MFGRVPAPHAQVLGPIPRTTETMVELTCNPSTQLEAGRSGIQLPLARPTYRNE